MDWNETSTKKYRVLNSQRNAVANKKNPKYFVKLTEIFDPLKIPSYGEAAPFGLLQWAKKMEKDSNRRSKNNEEWNRNTHTGTYNSYKYNMK